MMSADGQKQQHYIFIRPQKRGKIKIEQTHKKLAYKHKENKL
jgi:hypothetical protein